MKITSKIYQELNYQVQNLLFEQGLNLSAKKIAELISIASQQCVDRLHHAAVNEQLTTGTMLTSSVDDYIDLLKQQQKKQNPTSLFNRWSTLEQELRDSIENQVLALAYHEHWQQHLKQETQGYPSLWTSLCAQYGKQEQLMFLEQWGCVGHPYHPNFRTKTGFNRREVIHYSPEFNTEVPIHWAALHRSIAFTSIDETSYNLLFAEHFSLEYQNWRQTLVHMQYDPDDYLPLPVHPWQWENTLRNMCAPLIESRLLLMVKHLQNTKPSMSFRTMMTFGTHSPHLKLAVAVHTTSSLRTVSPASVSNSSVLSNWIETLLARHHYYNERLFIARDLAGINSNHPAIPAHGKKQLAMIVRENPLQRIKASQQLVPLAALFAVTPVKNAPLLIEIIEASRLNPVSYFKHYCRAVLEGQLHLLMYYGLTLEAHQQNTLVIMEQHRPAGLVIRDLGGIKICLHPLYDKVSKPELHPDSTITCTELQGLSNTFIHGNLLSNLTPFIQCLHEYYGLPTALFWKQVRQLIEELLQSFKAELPAEIYQWHEEHFLSLAWQQKSLLRMRLNLDQDEMLYSTVVNPLSQIHD